jgi:hypothetical protein
MTAIVRHGFIRRRDLNNDEIDKLKCIQNCLRGHVNRGSSSEILEKLENEIYDFLIAMN